jgi:hypothetical protein
MSKLTWETIYKDFKRIYPDFSKEAYYYEPYDYAEIKVWIKGGKRFVYNYDKKTGRFVKDIHDR